MHASFCMKPCDFCISELHSKGKNIEKIVVVGAGKIGATIADLLASTGEYAVTVVDRSQARAMLWKREQRLKRRRSILKMRRRCKPLLPASLPC